ncbi:hypothetical protein THAOC_28432, partial [Thalassiosira oceanica]
RHLVEIRRASLGGRAPDTAPQTSCFGLAPFGRKLPPNMHSSFAPHRYVSSHCIAGRGSSCWEKEQRHGDRGRGGTNGTPDASMSYIAVDGGPANVCANCGKGSGGEGGVKLKDCTACRLVKYCGVDCQRAHRKRHKRACKQRAAELRDERLYGQGHERPEGDFCQICTLPIPLPMGEHSGVNVCCMKRICDGCNMAAGKRGMDDCVFCRTPMKNNDADVLAKVQARVVKKDPEALFFLGNQYEMGVLGLQRDMRKAVELWTEAAELGSGVQKDMAKALEFYKKAAMQGHVESRHNLGCFEEYITRNRDRALRHFLISAKMGDKDSVENIKKFFMDGVATRDQYTEALKGYQNAVEEMKSHDRDESESEGLAVQSAGGKTTITSGTRVQIVARHGVEAGERDHAVTRRRSESEGRAAAVRLRRSPSFID